MPLETKLLAAFVTYLFDQFLTCIGAVFIALYSIGPQTVQIYTRLLLLAGLHGTRLGFIEISLCRAQGKHIRDMRHYGPSLVFIGQRDTVAQTMHSKETPGAQILFIIQLAQFTTHAEISWARGEKVLA